MNAAPEATAWRYHVRPRTMLAAVNKPRSPGYQTGNGIIKEKSGFIRTFCGVMNMTKLESQIQELAPSVKDALFRRLLFADNLAWLRDENRKNQVIGFEVDPANEELSGFALVAIQRHTIIAYVSDKGEIPRLILFPSLEVLFDPGFELLDLLVIRKVFTSASFLGRETGRGRFGDMVKDLTPPNRKMDIPETVVEQMASQMEQEETHPQSVKEPAPVKPVEESYPQPEPIEDYPPEDYPPEEEDEFEEPGYTAYDDYGYEDDYEETPAREQTRSERLSSQSFSSLPEVIDFMVKNFGMNRNLAVTLANKVLQSKVDPKHRVALAVKLFCKLLDEGKI